MTWFLLWRGWRTGGVIPPTAHVAPLCYSWSTARPALLTSVTARGVRYSWN
jgi:hypothetical protein